MIAGAYERGWGVKQDFARSLDWYAKAAAQGSGLAKGKMGAMLIQGLGAPRDVPRAVALMAEGAESGFPEAQHNYAFSLETGATGKPDYAAAARWYELAAKGGFENSMWRLAVMNAQGKAPGASLAKSYTWAAVIDDHGGGQFAGQAAKLRAALDKRLTEAQRRAARAAAERWLAANLKRP